MQAKWNECWQFKIFLSPFDLDQKSLNEEGIQERSCTTCVIAFTSVFVPPIAMEFIYNRAAAY